MGKTPQYTIRSITPKALKEYKELGLMEAGLTKAENGAKLMDIYLNPEQLQKILTTTFEDDFSDIDMMDDVDLGAVSTGIADFLAQLAGNLPG